MAAVTVTELFGLLRAKPVFDRVLASQIVLSKDQVNPAQILELYSVAQQKQGLDHNVVNVCLTHFARNGNAKEAQKLITKAVEDGVEFHTSWTMNLASAQAADKNFQQALRTLNVMKEMKGKVVLPFFPTLIKTLGGSTDGLAWCLREFFRMLRTHIEVPSKVYSSLISQFGKAGNIEVCIQLFNEMKKNNVEVSEVIYTTVIDAYARDRDMAMCESVFSEMKSKGVRPNNFTYNTLIKGWGKLGNVVKCEEIVREMEETEKIPKTEFTYGVLMDAYRRAGDVEKCAGLMKEIEERGDVKPNVVIYTTLIAAYGQAGNVEECEKLYKEMQVRGIHPTDFTYNTMADVFEKAARKEGREGEISYVEKGLFISFLLALFQ